VTETKQGSTSDIRQVGVIGCGAVGSGVAQICAESDLDVRVVLSSKDSIARGQRRLLASLNRRVVKGAMSAQERDAIADRICFTTDFGELADRQLIIEAVSEDESTKRSVLKEVDANIQAPNLIIGSTTSTIPIMRLAGRVERATQVIGIHFFNPVPVLPLVELTACLLTGADTKTRTESFVTDVLGKRVIWSKDRAGFVVNSLLLPYLLSAVRMLESGFAVADDIDAGMELGCAHPMGPLKLADFIGLDTLTAMSQTMYDEFKEPSYSPPALLLRMVDAKLLGRKTGQGFFQYDS
jgi:3-hydroxybutyryl-CoA dehydrogenase